ncbi:MAG: ATP-binding cassette domain-containing protein [bacterium]
MLKVENLTRKFRALTAVDDVGFEVARGEIFGFLGPNGAGKTTTISMICTLLRPTSGRIELDGIDVVRRPGAARGRMGLIFQDPSLDERLTAAENMEIQARLYGVPRGEIEGRIDELLRLVRLNERRNSLVKTFSGGMRRRLEVARGLIHSPRILFLDEPTLGLDLQTRKLIWDYIVRLRREKDITIFMTTHYIEEAEICDRVAIIDRGKIVALDSPRRLVEETCRETITLTTDDDETFCRKADEILGVSAACVDGTVRISATGGDALIPELFTRVPVRIRSISYKKPTLDDAFIELTGRSVREEEGGGVEVRMRSMYRLTQRRR